MAFPTLIDNPRILDYASQGVTPRGARPSGRPGFYPSAVSTTTEMDRVAWAKYLAELQAGGVTQAQIAELAGTHLRTVQKWFSRDVDPSPTSVRNLARGLGVNPPQLLARIGWLTEIEVGLVASTAQALDQLAAEINALLKSRRLPPAWLARLRRMLHQQVENWLDMYRAGNPPIEDKQDRRPRPARRGGA